MLSAVLRSLGAWWRSVRDRRAPRWRLAYVEGDELPEALPAMTLVVASDGGTLWTCGMICPCGCGRRLEMMLLPEVRPHWRLREDRGGPSLHPSVWAADGCRSHFWLKEGRVVFCRD